VNLALLLDVAAGGLLLGGLYALIAVGLNLQYGLMRVLNVAHGEFLMLGGYLTYLLHVHLGMDPLVSLVVTDSLGLSSSPSTGSMHAYVNQPTAAFTAGPNPAGCGASVTFDGNVAVAA